jgi:hypothetical protein
VTSSPPSASESQILAAIRQAANLVPGLCLWRLSQGGLVRRGTHTYRAGLSVNGASDLIGLLNGKFIACEIKAHRGRLEAEQEHFLELVRSKGGFACVCRSVEEFLEAMKRAAAGESE